MKLLEKVHLVSLFICSFLLLSSTVLIWGCSTLKQKLTKKGRSNLIVSHKENMKDQAILTELRERELMWYFGEYATLVLTDGFRISADSGLMGNSGVLIYRSESLGLDSQRDSLNVERLSDSRIRSEVRLATEEIEKAEERVRAGASWWWWIVLVSVGWLVYRGWRCLF